MYTAKYACRICLFETFTKDNPLITPCKCSGTMRFIHIKCLQQWLKSKLTMKQSGNSISFYWKNLDCELCKEQYPPAVSLEKKIVDLIEIPKPDSNYIILEALIRDRNSTRGLHVISMQQKTLIRLGRGHDSDVRISDISVSRTHALISLVRGNYYFEDHMSKFGTLVQIKKPICIEGKINYAIQVGRSVIHFQIKKPFNLLQSCLCCGSNSD